MSERIPNWWRGNIPSQALELTDSEEARLRQVDREFPDIVELIPVDRVDPRLAAEKDVHQIVDQALRACETKPTTSGALDDPTDPESPTNIDGE